MSNAHERDPTATAASSRVLAEGTVEANPNSEILGEVGERPDTPWTRLEQHIDDYVDGYELVDCEDDQGRTGDYAPTETERLLISDAIQGLLADEELVDLIVEARDYQRASRRAEDRCEFCGHPLPAIGKPAEHWGQCRGAQPSAELPQPSPSASREAEITGGS